MAASTLICTYSAGFCFRATASISRSLTCRLFFQRQCRGLVIPPPTPSQIRPSDSVGFDLLQPTPPILPDQPTCPPSTPFTLSSTVHCHPKPTSMHKVASSFKSIIHAPLWCLSR
ncbi:hypothetical protein L202_07005, partial [Cryptococcus amylolentus CBS 6039]